MNKMEILINFDTFLKVNDLEKEKQIAILSNFLGLQKMGFKLYLGNAERTHLLLINDSLAYETVKIS